MNFEHGHKLYVTDFENINLKQFEEFLESLDSERDTWQLDLQGFKDYNQFFKEIILNHK